MKRWKNRMVLLLTAVLLGTLTACGAKTPALSAASQAESAAPSSVSSGAASGKTLVVYFSATGHTKAVVAAVASAAGAELFEIEPKEPYSAADLNYNDAKSRVSVEHADPERQNVALATDSVPNWAEYDTVYIGYPIWWGVAAWPVRGIVAANDFSGKTVIPFCTSASSALGDSAAQLREAASGGNWQAGKRFSSGAGAAEVTEWVQSLSH